MLQTQAVAGRAQQVLDLLGEHGVAGELVRVVDHDIRLGVEADMGDAARSLE